MHAQHMKTEPQAQQSVNVELAGDAEVFIPQNVCARMIRFAVEDHKLTYLKFTGGCQGNLKAISKLLVGMDVEDIIRKLSGNTCGKKNTSCTDQLCIALRNHMEQE
jgi:uncharacterized protein (TIGR03905 family)